MRGSDGIACGEHAGNGIATANGRPAICVAGAVAAISAASERIFAFFFSLFVASISNLASSISCKQAGTH